MGQVVGHHEESLGGGANTDTSKKVPDTWSVLTDIVQGRPFGTLTHTVHWVAHWSFGLDFRESVDRH